MHVNRLTNVKFLCQYIFLIVLFNVSFYCDIYTNIHATLIIVIYSLMIVIVQCCNSIVLNSILKKWFEVWIFESIGTYVNYSKVNK